MFLLKLLLVFIMKFLIKKTFSSALRSAKQKVKYIEVMLKSR